MCSEFCILQLKGICLVGMVPLWVRGRRRFGGGLPLLYLMWTLWKERNERAFNDIEQSNQTLKHSFLYTLINWARVFIEDHTLSMIDFIEWLYV